MTHGAHGDELWRGRLQEMGEIAVVVAEAVIVLLLHVGAQNDGVGRRVCLHDRGVRLHDRGMDGAGRVATDGRVSVRQRRMGADRGGHRSDR